MTARVEEGVAPKDSVAGFAVTDRAIVALISVFVFLPTILFATSMRAPAAALVVLGCLGALTLILHCGQTDDASILASKTNMPLLAALVVASAALLLAGGALHLIYAPSDWRTRDAVLADIVQSWLPVLYRRGETDYLLRAPLGMYLLPALVGHALGLGAAHVALWLQNSLLLGAILYVFARIGRGWRHAAILLCYAGCAALGAGIWWTLSNKNVLATMFRSGVDAWNPYFQYSGSLVQLFWVPNHALPAWWLAALMLLQSRRQVDLATLGATIGGALFWSPLAVLPAIGWVVFRIAVELKQSLTSRRLWMLAGVAPCFLPVAIYMVIGAGAIERETTTAKPLFLVVYAIFLAACFLHLAYIAAYRATLPAWLKPPLVFSTLVLVVLPFYSFGPTNDLVMRGSISALVIVAFSFGAVLLAPENRGRRPFFIGLGILAICLPSALFELSRSTLRTRYDISDCSLFESNAAMGAKGIAANYVVERGAVPGWLMNLDNAPRLVATHRPCWSDGGEPPRPRDDAGPAASH